MPIATERLLLEEPDDAERAAIASRDRAGRAWAADYPTDGDVVAATMTAAAPWLGFQVRERSSGLAIGGVGFHGAPDAEGAVEIGYGLAESARGKGYATEAVAALVAYARDRGARAVIARTEPGNAPSAAVLDRCGFLLERPAEGDDDLHVHRRVL